ncbi:MAG: RimK family alpha-L-glutamate ligase [Candidatus Anstonellales archaeon]
MEIGVVYSFVGFEKKEIFHSAQKSGVMLRRIKDEEAVLDIQKNGDAFPDLSFMRSVSTSRSIYISKYLECSGKRSINKSNTFEVCGDKALTSMMLAKEGIETPKTVICFSPEVAKKSADIISYPYVVKPVVGSWGRLVHKVNDPEAATAIFEYKELMQNPMHRIYYMQEYIEKEGKDIRVIVCGTEVIGAISRISNNGDFRTNHHLGGMVEEYRIEGEIEEVCAKIGEVFGGEEILGIDLAKSTDGLKVLEVNHTPEFTGFCKATGTNVADKMIEHIKRIIKS